MNRRFVSLHQQVLISPDNNAPDRRSGALLSSIAPILLSPKVGRVSKGPPDLLGLSKILAFLHLEQ